MAEKAQKIVSKDQDSAKVVSMDKDITKTTQKSDIIFDPVKNVTKKKEIWRLGVIIDDMWSVYKGEIEDHIELLLRDAKGDIIQATINHDDIDIWKSKLIQGKTYYMHNFKVAENDATYKMTLHKFRLIFVGPTRVEDQDIPGIPITAFKFKDFGEVINGKYAPDILVDVIGVINSMGKAVTPTTTRKGNIAFTLKDQSDVVLDCTLWDSLSVQFIDRYNKRSDSGPFVLIIRHACVKEAQGTYPLQFTNVWDGTKLLFDQTIPEIQSFLNSLPKEMTYLSQHCGVSNSTQFYSQTSGGSQFNSFTNL